MDRGREDEGTDKKSVQGTEDAPERRRPGRAWVAPALVPLVRDTVAMGEHHGKEWEPDGRNAMDAVRGIMLSAVASVAMWWVLVVAVRWLVGS